MSSESNVKLETGDTFRKPIVTNICIANRPNEYGHECLIIAELPF